MPSFEKCCNPSCPVTLAWAPYVRKNPGFEVPPHCHLSTRQGPKIIVNNDVIARWRDGRFERYAP